MDDFSIYRDSFDQYLHYIELVLQHCAQKNLTLNLEKCHFMVRHGIVFGYKISKKEIKVDKVKIEVIAKLPLPIRIKDILSFLGYAGFYCRFIKDFSKISRPLSNLLVKNVPFTFDSGCLNT